MPFIIIFWKNYLKDFGKMIINMNKEILKEIFSRERLRISDLLKHTHCSSSSCYRNIKELEELGVITYDKGKILLTKNPVSIALKKLLYSGADLKILQHRYLKALIFLLTPKTLTELREYLGISRVQAYRVLGKLSQFLTKRQNTYVVSEKFSELRDFLREAKQVIQNGAIWSDGKTALLKVPEGMPFTGTLTAFSRFNEFGIALASPSNYVVKPTQKLTIEEILVHALRFSENANDVLLCIIFYLKNKGKIDIVKVERFARKFGVLQLWLDIVSWLSGLPVKNKNLFLPWAEFQEKAALYNVRAPPKFGKSVAKTLYEKIEKNISNKLEVFLIGGNALMEYGLKNATKDIDIAVRDTQSAKTLAKALIALGFHPLKRAEKQYQRLEFSMMFEKEGFPRIDLFVKKICNCLEFSEEMQKRSKFIGGKKLLLYKASLEDIFLLKSVSSRDSDLADCAIILSKALLNWNIILREIRLQKNAMKELQELIILDHFDALEEMLKISVPIKNAVIRQALEKAILYICREKPASVAEIRARLDFAEYAIRNMLRKLVKSGKLRKIEGKPIKFIVAGK
jgi:predicted transcriptional regulator